VDAVDVIDCLLDDILLAKRRPHSALDAAFDVIRSGFLFFAVAASNFYWLEKRVYFLAVVELVRMTASKFFSFF